MGSTNSTKVSKLSAVKALAKSMLGGKSSAKAAPAKKAPKAAAPKANLPKASLKAAAKAAPKANLKAAPKGKLVAKGKAAVPAEKPAGKLAKGAAKAPAKVDEKLQAKAAPAPKVVAKAVKKGGARTGSSRSYALDAESVCREVACEGLSTTAGYCRLHYIKNWKKIKRKELILKEGKLNQYIEELVAKYPDKYIEAIRQDLAGDKDFAKVIYDLDLDESVDDFDIDGESADAIIDTIKRDFDDEGEGGF